VLLAGWTLNENIQPYIDIYLSLPTFVEVQRAFPYLVAREFASGGGDVSAYPHPVPTPDSLSEASRSPSLSGTLLTIKYHLKLEIQVFKSHLLQVRGHFMILV
jgi:hypothetical protein